VVRRWVAVIPEGRRRPQPVVPVLDGPLVAGHFVYVAIVDLRSGPTGDRILQGIGDVREVGRRVLQAEKRP